MSEKIVQKTPFSPKQVTTQIEKKVKKVEQDLYQFQQDFNRLCATVLRIRKALLDFLDHYSLWGLSSDSGYLKKILKELKGGKKDES